MRTLPISVAFSTFYVAVVLQVAVTARAYHVGYSWSALGSAGPPELADGGPLGRVEGLWLVFWWPPPPCFLVSGAMIAVDFKPTCTAG